MPAEAPAGRRDPRRGHERSAAGAAPVGGGGAGSDRAGLGRAVRAARRVGGRRPRPRRDRRVADGRAGRGRLVVAGGHGRVRGRARAAAGGREPRRHLHGQREQDRRGAGRAPLRVLRRPGAARALAARRPAARAHRAAGAQRPLRLERRRDPGHRRLLAEGRGQEPGRPRPRAAPGRGGRRAGPGGVARAPRRAEGHARGLSAAPSRASCYCCRVRVLVTGSAGHLGEALVRALEDGGDEVVGIDLVASPETMATGSIADRAWVRRWVRGADAILHAATLHKPHVGSHRRRDFVDTNVTGTLNLLEEGVAAGVGAFVFTSTTSAFGRALVPPPGAPAAWITEDVSPVPRNIYGATKTAAEDLCELVHRDHGLPCLILRTSRFFPEADDRDDVRSAYDDLNVKVNELLCRRVDIEDVVSVHRLALARAPCIGFGRYVISATTPFRPGDLAELRRDAPAVVRRRFPDYEAVY